MSLQIVATNHSPAAQQAFRLLDIEANVLKSMRPVNVHDVELAGWKFRKGFPGIAAPLPDHVSYSGAPDVVFEQLRDETVPGSVVHIGIVTVMLGLNVEIGQPWIHAGNRSRRAGLPRSEEHTP